MDRNREVWLQARIKELDATIASCTERCKEGHNLLVAFGAKRKQAIATKAQHQNELNPPKKKRAKKIV